MSIKLLHTLKVTFSVLMRHLFYRITFKIENKSVITENKLYPFSSMPCCTGASHSCVLKEVTKMLKLEVKFKTKGKKFIGIVDHLGHSLNHNT